MTTARTSTMLAERRAARQASHMWKKHGQLGANKGMPLKVAEPASCQCMARVAPAADWLLLPRTCQVVVDSPWGILLQNCCLSQERQRLRWQLYSKHFL